MTEERFNAWKHAFADCLRLAMDKDYFSDYEWFDLGKQNLETDEEFDAFDKEKADAFLKVFGEQLW